MPLLPLPLSPFVSLMREQITSLSGSWFETGLDYGSEDSSRGRILIIELPQGSPETRIEISSSVSLYPPSLLIDTFTNNSTFDYIAGDERGGVIKFCLAPDNCTPSEPVELLGSGNTPLTDVQTQVMHNKLDYRLNDGPVQTFIASSEANTLERFLDELQSELGQVSPDTDHWVFGNAAQGPAIMYETGFNDPVILRPAGKTGMYDFSTTLEFIFMDRPGDFVGYFMGDTVTLHACGVFGFV